jgi:hypothetical protein
MHANRIAIVVLACASPPYDRTIEAIRRTWGAQRVPGVDVYYLYGNPHDEEARRELSRHVDGRVPTVDADAIHQAGDVLIAGCADHIAEQEDCLLRKRLRAFEYLTAEDAYDLIYTVCATSYVDQERLARYTGSLSATQVIAGAISLEGASSTPFVSGASMILSADIARLLGIHRQEIIDGNTFGHYDDVTIGHWIATRVSRVPLATFIADIRQQRPMTSAHVFVSCPDGTVDYVTVAPADQRPAGDAFHYHFHSAKPDDMVLFHERYYAGEATDGAESP